MIQTFITHIMIPSLDKTYFSLKNNTHPKDRIDTNSEVKHVINLSKVLAHLRVTQGFQLNKFREITSSQLLATSDAIMLITNNRWRLPTKR